MRRESGFVSVRTEGGLLPPDLLTRIVAGDRLEGLRPGDYHLAEGERLREAISRSWNRLVAAWSGFRTALEKLPATDTGTTLTRERWLLILFQELGYGRLRTTRAINLDGVDYPISHLWGAVPIHLVSFRIDLDRRTPGAVGAARWAPHSMVQEFLNRSDGHLWGFVSNGFVLRLLRDNLSMTRQAFVEFDLQAMFETEAYSDFVLLWLLCHESRVDAERPELCWLERWMATAHREGTRALDQLRDGVEEALKILGTGFLEHPANEALREAFRSGQLDQQEFYRQLLRLVYRLLFLFVTEDRDLLLLDTDRQARERYMRFYSTGRLRDLAGRHLGSSHGDLWRGLSLVMSFLGSEEGCPALALPPLGGLLWDPASTRHLNDCRLTNRALLDALRALAYRSDHKVRRPVDYRNLGSEELGSVYESLLELHPEVDVATRRFTLTSASGSERKTTGSYYTHTTLINLILDETLDPLIDEATRGKPPAEAEAALLALKVCDPATGSGHFLVAAANRLAKHLAAIRTGEDEPSPEAQRDALRDVVGRCLYGVDLNPMAVELAKISLWLEAHTPGKPLTFLDHHIKCGNSIIGTTPALIARGIPDEAFQAIDKGDDQDDKKACTSFKQRNRKLRAGQQTLSLHLLQHDLLELSTRARKLSDMADDNPALLAAKERAYQDFADSEEMRRQWLLADAWCATFTVPKTLDTAEGSQTFDVFYQLRDQGTLPADEAALDRVREQSERYGFFHWHLAFPDVFTPIDEPSDDDPTGWTGGFDLVFGNPPWDTLSPDVREFFRRWCPDIAEKTKEEQNEIVEELLDDPSIARLWADHQRDLHVTAHFFRRSGRYRLFAPGNLGKGDLNIYRAFVELALTTTREGGAASQVVPAGFYSGANAAAIRRELFDHWTLTSMWGFVNANHVWFSGIVQTTRFCIYVAFRKDRSTEFESGFSIESPEELAVARSTPFVYRIDDIRAASPDALLIVEVAPGMDAQVLAKLTRDRPTFKDLNQARGWHPYRAEVHMGNDQHLFTKEPVGLPVYEGRMIDFYDHRAKNYVGGSGRSSKWEQVPFDSPSKGIHPQWFLPEDKIPDKLGDSPFRYRISYTKIVNPKSDRRCLKAAIVPPMTVCGDTVPTIAVKEGDEWRYATWIAMLNSVCLDYLVRKRVSLHVVFSVMDTLPLPEIDPSSPVGIALIDRVLRLTCVSPEMDDFRTLVIDSAGLPGDLGQPPATDEEERELLRAEIDAIVARDVFGLTRDEVGFVLDTFEALRRSEEEPLPRGFGEFRSKRLVLEAYDRVWVKPAAVQDGTA